MLLWLNLGQIVLIIVSIFKNKGIKQYTILTLFQKINKLFREETLILNNIIITNIYCIVFCTAHGRQNNPLIYITLYVFVLCCAKRAFCQDSAKITKFERYNTKWKQMDRSHFLDGKLSIVPPLTWAGVFSPWNTTNTLLPIP